LALVLARWLGAARAGRSSTGRYHQRGSHEATAEDLRAAAVQHIEGVRVQISASRAGGAAEPLLVACTWDLRSDF
jgi:hypothetical protein